MNWKKVKLGDTATFINGYAFKPTDWKTKGLPIIRIQNLTGNAYECNYFDGKVPYKYNVKDGDILVSWSASLGVYEWNGGNAVLNQHIFKVVLDKLEIDKKFMKFLLMGKLEAMKKEVHGATMQHITKGKFDNLDVNLPDLATQKHIAEVLDKADALRQQNHQLLAHYDELLQSTFIELFGDPVKNPKGWEVKKVIDTCEGCIVPGRDKPKSFTGNIPWITTDDLNHLWNTEKSNKNLGLSEIELKEVKARRIPKNSVIMTCVGDLGIVSVAKKELVMNQQLHAFICGDKIDKYFLAYSLSHRTDFMYKMASTTTVPYMNKTVCNSIPIPVPPLPLQQHFAKIVEQIEAQKAQAQTALAESEALFEGLLAGYFNA